MMTFCKTIVQYHKYDTDFEILSRFASFPLYAFVYVFSYMQILNNSDKWEDPDTKGCA